MNELLKRTPRQRGISLPELMISLSISTMLLVAVSAAFSASAAAVEQNDRFFRASQAGRVTMNQLVTEIRRCDTVRVTSTSIDVIRPAEDLSAGEIYRRFAYDAATKRVTVQIFKAGDVGGQVYTMANNVEAATFGPAEMVKDSNEAWIVVRVPITLALAIGSNDITLNGAAAPRRARKE